MALIVEGKRRAAENAHQDRAWLAWTTAALGRAKQMPPLAELVGKKKAPPERRPSTAEQLLTTARLWTAATGGRME